eukprot:2821588-Prymnesium_polylepis.4
MEHKRRAVGRAILPHLVLERVVKYEQPVLHERSRLVGDTDGGAHRHVEPIMDCELRVGWARVRPHVHAGGHRRELRLERRVWRRRDRTLAPQPPQQRAAKVQPRRGLGRRRARGANVEHVPALAGPLQPLWLRLEPSLALRRVKFSEQSPMCRAKLHKQLIVRVRRVPRRCAERPHE